MLNHRVRKHHVRLLGSQVRFITETPEHGDSSDPGCLSSFDVGRLVADVDAIRWSQAQLDHAGDHGVGVRFMTTSAPVGHDGREARQQPH